MKAAECITFWTIYRNPADYPDKYVLRAFDVTSLRTIPVPRRDCQIFDSLDAARAAVPPGCYPFARDPNDDPSVVETWMQ